MCAAYRGTQPAIYPYLFALDYSSNTARRYGIDSERALAAKRCFQSSGRAASARILLI